jgi:hypothetical protein
METGEGRPARLGRRHIKLDDGAVDLHVELWRSMWRTRDVEQVASPCLVSETKVQSPGQTARQGKNSLNTVLAPVGRGYLSSVLQVKKNVDKNTAPGQ